MLTSEMREALHRAPGLELQEMITAQREALRAQRTTFAHLRREGLLTEISYEELLAEVDLALESTDETWARQALGGPDAPTDDQLMLAVIQARDLEDATYALTQRGIPSTVLRSSGGFLRQRNHVLLVGVPEGKLGAAVAGLQSATKGRVEFLPSADPLHGQPVDGAEALARSSEMKIHGATVFLFNVERYEVI